MATFRIPQMPLSDELRSAEEIVARKVAQFTEDAQANSLTFGAITCEKCPHEPACKFAWDLYNTDGDCLAGK